MHTECVSYSCHSVALYITTLETIGGEMNLHRYKTFGMPKVASLMDRAGHWLYHILEATISRMYKISHNIMIVSYYPSVRPYTMAPIMAALPILSKYELKSIDGHNGSSTIEP